MSDPHGIDLRFIGAQLKSISDRLSTMDDNLTVLTAIVMRMDGTMIGMVNELRALHAQHSRVQNRVKALENAAQLGSADA